MMRDEDITKRAKMLGMFADKKLSENTIDKIIRRIKNYDWKEKELLAEKAIALMKTCNTEQEILDRIGEISL